MPRLAPLALLVLALLAPAAAEAAYAPRLAVTLDPAERLATPAITTRITQAPGESATRSVRLTFPDGFGVNAPSVGSCSAQAEAQRACPADSKIGDAEATASGVRVSGPIHISSEGGVLRILVFLDGLGGLIQQKLVGRVEFPDGRIATVFDGLPNLATTDVTLRFLGGEKALVANPRTCGDKVFSAAFTSHAGEQATSEATVTITGCVERPRISSVSVRPARVRAGGRVTVRWRLSQATKGTRLILERRAGRRWRRVTSLVASGREGLNRRTLRLSRRARAGRYRVSLRATNSEGLPSRVVRKGFTVVARRR